MAAGILSIAASLAGQPVLSILLLAPAAIALIVLASVDVVVAVSHPASIRDPRLGLVLFTWVAACGVLGDSRGPLPDVVRLGFGVVALAGGRVRRMVPGCLVLLRHNRSQSWPPERPSNSITALCWPRAWRFGCSV